MMGTETIFGTTTSTSNFLVSLGTFQ